MPPLQLDGNCGSMLKNVGPLGNLSGEAHAKPRGHAESINFFCNTMPGDTGLVVGRVQAAMFATVTMSSPTASPAP